jgi:hypothetical protein
VSGITEQVAGLGPREVPAKRCPPNDAEGAPRHWCAVVAALRRRHGYRRGRAMGQLQPHKRDGEQAVCRRIVSKACASRPSWRPVHRADNRLRVGRLDISESELGAACDRGTPDRLRRVQHCCVVIPLDLNSNASVPMHIVATTIQLVFMLAAIGFGAAALHGWLRLHSIASLVTSVVAGVASFMAAPYAPTPILGIGERISIGAFLLWVAVLAAALWRAPVDAADPQQ